MLRLDQAIAAWREQLVAGGIESPDVLDELESHLRDEVEHRVGSGLAFETAFTTAVEQMGKVTLLRSEFRKACGLEEAIERLKHFISTLAGIPNPILATAMNTSPSTPPIEPAWATYVKAAAFAAPALCLWTLSVIFVFPKLQLICREAGVAMPGVYRFTHFLSDHFLLISAALVVILALLERRSDRWPKYRRASVGAGVFLLNSAVLILIFVMVILAILAAPALRHAA